MNIEFSMVSYIGGYSRCSSKGKTKSKTERKTKRKTIQIRPLTINIGDTMAILQSLKISISYASQDILVTVYSQRFQLSDITQTDTLTEKVT